MRSVSLTSVIGPATTIAVTNFGMGTSSLNFETGATNGVLSFQYDFYQTTNNVRFYYQGVLLTQVTDTNFGTINVPYGPGTSTVVTVTMNETGANLSSFYNYVLSITTPGVPSALVGLGGDFTSINGEPHLRVAVLNGDGSIYTGFDPGAVGNVAVYSLSVYTNRAQPWLLGKIVAGGDFTSIAGAIENRVARLNWDGTIDTNFNVGLGPDQAVRAVVVQADGKVVIGGAFTNVNLVSRNFLARLTTNGMLDATYNQSYGPNNVVNAMVLQPDGKVIIGGKFTRVAVPARNGVARLNTDGTLDTNFTAVAGANAEVKALALAADGSVLIGGDFTTFNGSAYGRIARLATNGSLVALGLFNPGAGGRWQH